MRDIIAYSVFDGERDLGNYTDVHAPLISPHMSNALAQQYCVCVSSEKLCDLVYVSRLASFFTGDKSWIWWGRLAGRYLAGGRILSSLSYWPSLVSFALHEMGISTQLCKADPLQCGDRKSQQGSVGANPPCF